MKFESKIKQRLPKSWERVGTPGSRKRDFRVGANQFFFL